MVIVLFLIFLLIPTQVLGKNLSWELAKVTIKATFDITKHQVSGQAQIELPPRKVVWINVQNLALKDICLASKRFVPEIENGAFRVMATTPGQVLKIKFVARFPKGKNQISKKNIVLTENWCPSIKGLAYYDLWITVPKRFKAIAPADIVKVKRRHVAFYHFIFNHPSCPPPLIGGRYFYYEKIGYGITVAVYLLKNEPKLANLYQKKAFSYLKSYSKLFGKYPYKRLSIVESSFEIGCAFPTMIIFGEKVLRLPFIPEISLRHEILHNWFGNGVYVNEETGNWCEALVTYLADYQQAKKNNQDVEFRHKLLVEYQSYVTPENDFPLKNFHERYDKASQAIGYGKGMMVFHMLNRELGDKIFFEGIRTLYSKYLFRKASWYDIKHIFEDLSKKDLSTFFDEWLNRTGLPELHLYRERIIPLKKDKYLVGLTICQTEPYYHLRLTLVITSEKETKQKEIMMSGPRTRVDIKIAGKPLEAFLDPEYHIARRLSDKEFPPVLARVFGANKGLIVLMQKPKINVYRPLISFLKTHHFTLETETVYPENVSSCIVYLEDIPQILKPLFYKQDREGFCIEVKENPFNPNLVMVKTTAKSAKEIETALTKLVHLGEYQRVCTRQGQIILKEKVSYEHGISVKLSGETRGIALYKLESLDDIARAASLNKIIFLGEEHDRYEHHLAQLSIIKWLHENGHNIAIGMEMFQKQFQDILDEYISGEINEIEFLKRTQYFKRWGYNWKEYKPILDYARKEKIPVIALNVPQELTDKVAKKGIEALTPQEKAELPEIDFENLAYREYLRWIYERHPEKKEEIKDFNSFYQAQLIWDEGMAESIVSYLRKHPDKQMVVLVGKAHVVYGYGIPSRVARRGYESYCIVLLGGDDPLEPGMADYVLFPPPKSAPFFAHLGVLVEETVNGLKVAKVIPHTPAQKAGLKEGDIIVKADGQEVKSVADLKLVLYQKGPKDKVKLDIRRHGLPKKITVGPFEDSKRR